MERDQGTGTRQSALLARWLAPAPPAPAPAADARGLLAEVEAALAGAFSKAAADGLLAPLREALDTPEDERDAAALGAAFERVEDVLEAAARRDGGRRTGG